MRLKKAYTRPLNMEDVASYYPTTTTTLTHRLFYTTGKYLGLYFVEINNNYSYKVCTYIINIPFNIDVQVI